MNPRRALLLPAALTALLAAPALRPGAAEPCDDPAPLPMSWIAERVYGDRSLTSFLSAQRTLALDAAGDPHVAYGGDALYYAQRDASGWQTETADARLGVGDVASLALDAADKAHIAYRDSANDKVRYATNASGAWVTELVAQDVNAPGLAIALDPAGKAHVAYQDFTADEVRYATNVSGAWVTSPIAPDAGQSCSIAVDAEGAAHVAAMTGGIGGDPTVLRYLTNASGRWKTQTVDDPARGGVGFGNSIALDSLGRVHIAYQGTDKPSGDAVTVQLKYATNATGRFVVQALDLPDVFGFGTSLALGPADEAHITCSGQGGLYHVTNATGAFVRELIEQGGSTTSVATRGAVTRVIHTRAGTLRHVSGSTGAWTSEEVDHSRDTGFGASLRLDAAGRAHIGHAVKTGTTVQSLTTGDLRYTTNSGGAWASQVVDASAEGFQETGIAVDPAAKAHLVYFRATSEVNAELRYATNALGGFASEAVDGAQLRFGGGGPAIALDSLGRPRVLWGTGSSAPGGRAVRYARRTAPGVWAAEVVDTATDGIARMSLALDGADRAHAAYWRFEDQTIRYATDASGSWVVTLVETGIAEPFLFGVGLPTLALDPAGRAHIAYLGQVAGAFTLRHATNASGSWTTESVSAADYACEPGIAVDAAGKVHVTFNCGGLLRYATNASGAWRSSLVDRGTGGDREFASDVFAADEGAGVAVVSVAPGGGGNCGQHSDIQLAADGSPRIVYSDDLLQDVKFAFPDDGSGVRAVTIDWSVSAGTAAAPADFAAASGTVGWSANDTATKTFTVPIANDAVLEGNETAVLVLSNPVGGSLGERTTATLVLRDDDAPEGAIRAFILPRVVNLRLGGKRAGLAVTGSFDTGPGVVDLSGPATLTAGSLVVSIPGLTKLKSGAYRYKGQGVDMRITPARTGSSKGTFKLVVARDLTGLVDPDAPLALRFDDVIVDGTGVVTLTGGRYKLGRARGELSEPALFLYSVKATLAGAGKDGLTMKAGIGGLGATPDTAPEVRIALGPTYAETIAGGDFEKSGDRFVYRGAKGGIVSATLDYARETLVVKAAGIDLGTFADGAQPVVVTVGTGATTRSGVLRMVRTGKVMRY